MLKRLFGFDPAQNSVRTEVFAGITSFLTMSYILAVNPQLFASLDGMPRGAVFTTTALIAVLGSLLMAIVAKLPFGVAPGMGSNTFFVFAICVGMIIYYLFISCLLALSRKKQKPFMTFAI